MFKRSCLIILLILISCRVSAHGGRVYETDDYWLKISPRSVRVGEAVRLLFYSPREVKITGMAVGQTLRFYRYGKYYRALIGIYPKTKPDTYKFNLKITDARGKSVMMPAAIEVLGREFASTSITLPAGKKELSSDKKLVPERKKLADYINTESARLFWRGRFIRPARGRISQVYGVRNIINGELSYHHNGIDIAAPEGAPVLAGNDGRVILASYLAVRGKTVIIDHGQGTLSAYFHLQVILAKPGSWVSKGELIGRVGQTGMATGPHLHWTTYIHSVPVNPVNFLAGNLL